MVGTAKNEDAGEIERRRDDALRRALTTPPKPKRESGKPKEPKSSKEKPAK